MVFVWVAWYGKSIENSQKKFYMDIHIDIHWRNRFDGFTICRFKTNRAGSDKDKEAGLQNIATEMLILFIC